MKRRRADMMDPKFQRDLARIGELIAALDQAADSPLARQTRELVQTLMQLQGDGLERTLELIHDDARSGQLLIDHLAEDPTISNLLILHGLHPFDLETRVRRALESVKPRLGLHGGDVELLSVSEEGLVKLRLEGNCHGCPSSVLTLKSSIEEAIYAAAPDAIGLEVEGAVDRGSVPPGVVPKFTACPEPVGNAETLSVGVNL